MTATNRETTSAAPDELILSRIIDAPRELVYRAFTDPRQAEQWFAPPGCTTACEMDVRPGGAYRTIITAPDGSTFPIKGVYREVVAPARLVYTEDLSEHPAEWRDELDAKLRQAGSHLSLEYIVTVTFEESDGKTRLSMSYRFDSPVDRAAHEQADWMQGYADGLERLQALLARA